MTQLQAIRGVARTFGILLRAELGLKKLTVVIARNRKEKDLNVCHSHDFTDANMIMADAFKKVLGRPFRSTLKDNAIFNEAWDTAKTAEFKY